ncbi:MAG: VWA domain-containing protein [Candidatus Eremiobacteraeota bacterium]|nr:VWA domain-containing protein [Candidatus Eremiobacteraeota bacterium]
MGFKPKNCPVCHDGSKIDGKLHCAGCGNQLEYIDAEGTLGVQRAVNRCGKCHTENPRSSVYCESCGTRIAVECPQCKGVHPAGATVCAVHGEPLQAPRKEQAPVSAIITQSAHLVTHRYRKAFLVPAMLALLVFGYLFYEKLHSHTIVVVPTASRPAIDVVFVVDSTGSMADEIKVVQDKIKDMMAKIKSGQPVPDVRFGLVAFRDRGDDYVVKKFEFTSDIQKFQSYVNTINADGGGDTKESVAEALHTAINDMPWDKNQSTRKLLFLIGDAGPHTEYSDGLDYQSEASSAKDRGIKIYTLGCSGIEEDGESEFRIIAQATGGTFDYLTYRQQYVDDTGATYYRLKSGKDYYSVKGSGDDTSWREGVKDAVAKGMAKPIAPAGSLGPGSASGGGALPYSHMREEKMENNLDTVLTNKVQQELTTQGVKYGK